MRIAIDVMLLGGKHSGVEVSIEGLCSGLRDLAPGHEFLILHGPRYDARDLTGPSARTRKAPGWAGNRVGRILWERSCLPRAAARWGADLLHAPGYILPMGWTGPSVLTVYDIIALAHPEWCKWSNAAHYKRVLPPSVERAGVIVTPSEVVKQEIVEHLGAPAEKVHVVPLGISDTMRPASAAAIQTVRTDQGLDRPYILWVGNIEPKKNLEGMLKAFEAAAGEIPHDFVLAGRVAWRAAQALQAIESSPVRGRVKRLGYVPASMLPALYSGADLLVHWSLYEGAGLTPLEAMACGTPAIVSDGGALPEIAGQRATVVPLGDPDALADAIRRVLLDQTQLRESWQQASAWAQSFTWTRYAQSMLQIYEGACQVGAQA